MEDVFSEEEFLLYSPGVKETLLEKQALLWFNLISFNGKCWQSYGPIGAYSSFVPDDIYFFATELNHKIENEQDILESIENNPLPYMLLLLGSSAPIIFNKEEQLIHAVSEYEMDSIDTKSLAEGLNKCGYNFDSEPAIRVNLSMIDTASEILKRKIILNEYENMFSKEQSPEEKEKFDKLNHFLKLLLPDINAGTEPDIEALAAKAGVDIETARSIIGQLMKKFGSR
jgi:hypothetical protein